MTGSDQQETIYARQQCLSSIPRACEGCKIRKTRCDRTIPCSSCRTAGIACRSINPKSKSRLKTDKVSLLEEKINLLQSRLQTVEDELLTQSPRTPPILLTSGESSGKSQLGASHSADSWKNIYEGGSSFTCQSIQARQVAESVANANGGEARPDINASLRNLDNFIQPSGATRTHDEENVPHNMPFSATNSSLPLPAGLVLAILHRIQVQKPKFLWSYPFNNIHLVESLCQTAYFPVRPLSKSNFAAMHGVLYFIMKELMVMYDPLCKEYDLIVYLKSCKDTFDTEIRSYDVLTVASFENVLALVMGILIAQDETKPSLCCHLVSAAVRHCQILGYHRETTYRNSQKPNLETIRRLFWTIYVFDKNMALLLGRASYIQDFDIDVLHSPPSSDPAIRPWDEAFISCIKVARIQGKIYNRLYSATALHNNSDERSKQIEILSTALEQCRVEREQIDSSKVNDQQLFDLSKGTWDLIYYSTLTSLLFSSSVSDSKGKIDSKCVEAARICLETHLDCLSNYQASGIFSTADYANWVLLYSSFTPFIAVFLYAIATSSMEDVNLLDSVVATLKHTQTVAPAADRLFRICDSFARISRDLVIAKNTCTLSTAHSEQEGTSQTQAAQYAYAPRVDLLEEYWGMDMSSTSPGVHDMSALLESWGSGDLLTMRLLEEEFSETIS